MHRDLKPANILLKKLHPGGFSVFLCDFGVSKELSDSLRAGTVAGTHRWMAPEVVEGKGYEINADIFSLGRILMLLY